MTRQSLSVGRIVHFFQNPGESLEPQAAIVVALSESGPTLMVFNTNGGGFIRRSVKEFNEFEAFSHSYWTWPARVEPEVKADYTIQLAEAEMEDLMQLFGKAKARSLDPRDGFATHAERALTPIFHARNKEGA